MGLAPVGYWIRVGEEEEEEKVGVVIMFGLWQHSNTHSHSHHPSHSPLNPFLSTCISLYSIFHSYYIDFYLLHTILDMPRTGTVALLLLVYTTQHSLH